MTAAYIRQCQKCGTANRVGRYSIRLRPLCGQCGAPLAEPLVVRVGRFTRSTFTKVRAGAGWLLLGAALGTTLILLVIGQYRVDQKSSTPPTLQTEPEAKPPSPPSSIHGRDLQANKTELGSRPSRPVLTPAAPLPAKPSPPPLPRQLPSPIPTVEYVDMVNGYVFHTALADGKGSLKIVNGTRLHAIAKLVDPKQEKSVHTVLIRSNQQATVTSISDGVYRLLFALGKGWNPERQRFYEENRFAEFQKRLVFTTTERQQSDTIYEYHSVMEVTLHPVVGGTAKTTDISEAEFASY